MLCFQIWVALSADLYFMLDIIVPFCNRVPWLLQACRSLQRQTFPHWRAFLINDQTHPLALQPVEQMCAEDGRFNLLHLPSPKLAPGPWQARNYGIKSSSAPLLAFLDADDLWHPRKLERQLPIHKANPWSLSVSSYHRFQSTDSRLVETRCPPRHLNAQRLFRGNDIPLSTVILDRAIIENYGAFQPEHHEDYGLWLRLFTADKPPQYFCIDEPLMAYRLHPDSISSQRHRSIFAVYSLFRQHLPGRQNSLFALSAWSFGHAAQFLSRQGHRMFRMKPDTGKLPDPYLALLAKCTGLQDL
jgi:teichuronic acid biosynthesis glycosyltransferase TuaG